MRVARVPRWEGAARRGERAGPNPKHSPMCDAMTAFRRGETPKLIYNTWMSKTLIVVRHGHAVEGEADFARRLSDRGVSEVNSAGQALAQRGIKLDGVLTSSAPRAAETAKLLASRVGFDGVLQQARELYLAEATAILECVCATDDEIETLLLVGHNPGLSAFVEHMTGQVCELHTAQVVHLKLDIDHWNEASF